MGFFSFLFPSANSVELVDAFVDTSLDDTHIPEEDLFVANELITEENPHGVNKNTPSGTLDKIISLSEEDLFHLATHETFRLSGNIQIEERLETLKASFKTSLKRAILDLENELEECRIHEAFFNSNGALEYALAFKAKQTRITNELEFLNKAKVDCLRGEGLVKGRLESYKRGALYAKYELLTKN